MIDCDKINTFYIANEQETKNLATQLALCFNVPLVVTLSGEIGTGKTTLVRALLKEMGLKANIKSPTFSLVESYQWRNFNIHHFDLYRIHHEEELEYIGFRDYFSNQSICFIEWAEHAGQGLPPVDIHFNLSIKGAGRDMQIIASSRAGKKILAGLMGEK